MITIYLIIEAYWDDLIKELVQENEDRKDRLGIKASNPLHPPRPFDLRSPLMATHTKPLNLTRAEITRRLREMPVTRQQVRLMQKAIAELRRENALLAYMLSIR